MGVYRIRSSWKAEIWVDKKKVKTKAGFSTKKDAEKWYTLTLAQYHSDPTKIVKKRECTFDVLLEKYLAEHLPTVKQGTSTRYLIDITYRITPYFQYMELNKIDTGMIEAFRASIMKDLSKKSINNCCSTLQTMLKKAEKWKMITKNPYEMDPLKLPQFLTLAKECPYYAAYRLALDNGLRLGEIVGLSKRDINFERGLIHIHRQWLDKEKCYGSTKNGRERFINFDPQSSFGLSLLNAVKKSPDSEVIFVTRAGNRIGARKLSGYHFKRLTKKSGVRDITFHSLRHTFASWYMIDVGDIWSLMKILGHSDLKTTMRYSHHSTKDQRTYSFDWEKSSTLPAPSSARVKAGSG